MFMWVSGFARTTGSPAKVARAVSARHWRFLTSIPSPLAIRSIVKNPRLCGVNWYSIPGLPKPTISLTLIGSQPSALSRRLKPTARGQKLFLVFLLGLFGLCLALGIAFALSFTLGILLTLLNDFRFCRSRRRIRHCFRSRNHFFLDGGDMGDHLVLVSQELQLRIVRQIFHAHFDAEYQVTDIDFNVLRNIRGQTLNLDLAHELFENAAFGLHADRFTLEDNGDGNGQLLVHCDALQIDMEQGSLDRFELPIDDHRFDAVAIDCQIKNRVVSALGPQNAQNLPRIDRDRSRIFARAINNRGNFSANAHAPRGILGAWFTLLRFQNAGIRCFSHNSVSVLLYSCGGGLCPAKNSNKKPAD